MEHAPPPSRAGPGNRTSRAPRALLRPGVFLGFSAGLVMVLALYVPLPGTFASHPGGVGPPPGAAAECLRLSYRPAGASYWEPAVVRLHSRVLYEDVPGGTWYRAEAWEAGRHARLAGWLPAGRDSIDIQAHHTPVLRLPARGDRRTGRGGAEGYAHLVDALTSRKFAVHALRVPCSEALEPDV